MKKCILEGLLLLCMLAILPTTAFAVEGQDGECAVNSTLTVEAEEPIDPGSKPIEDLEPPGENGPEAVDPSKESASPTEEAPETETPTPPTESCTVTEGCILEKGHAGECVLAPEKSEEEKKPETPVEPTDVETCTKTDGCTLSEDHEGDCVLETGEPEELEKPEEQAKADALEVKIDEFLSANQAVSESGEGDQDALESMREEITEAYEALSPEAQALVSNYSSFLQLLNETSDDTNGQVWQEGTVAVIREADGDYAEYTTLQAAINSAAQNNPTTIEVVADEVVNQEIYIGSGMEITLTASTPYTITFSLEDNKNGFNVYDGGSLTIDGQITVTAKDSSIRSLVNVTNVSHFHLKNGELNSGSAEFSRGLICADTGAKIKMSGGIIRGSQNYESQGIYLQEWKSNNSSAVVSFEMTGGTIADCTSRGSGGGVFATSDREITFTMAGGNIQNCSANNGGGVYMSCGTFTMKGGTISGCASTDRGGGVYLSQQGTFQMEGGTISGCKAKYGGGAVYLKKSGAAFILKNGIISSCETGEKGYGGGVQVNEGASFTMEGGSITQCKAKHAGAVSLSGVATFSMSGGTISRCQSVLNGGGVYAVDMSQVTIGGTAAILECHAGVGEDYGAGGGVYLSGTSQLTMNSGTISDCAATEGGGVYARENTQFTLKNGTISGCQAVETVGAKGGGICIYGKDVKFIMENGVVSGNAAEYLGGGIYTESDATITAGAIKNNKSTCATGYGGGIYVHKEATLKLTNVMITDNTARALGGGIWSCRTGDIKIYVTDGGAVFDNEAISDGGKTANQAGDDIASTVTFPAVGYLLISHHMLGGGANRYYADGGVTYFSTTGLEHHHNEGWGLGAPDGTTARYDAATSALVTETYITEAIALKNVVSEDAKKEAAESAKLIISGNSASRGGGIGTNGNLIIGTPGSDAETGNLTVKKEVTGSGQETDQKFSIQVTLEGEKGTAITGEYGEMTFTDGVATVDLKAGQSVTATGLPTGISYMVKETPESQNGYHATYTNQNGTITKDTTVTATVTNKKSGGGPSDTYTSVSVKKVWKLDDGGTAADSVEVSLLKDGAEHDRVTLNAGNSWSHTWNHLNDKYHWTVEEIAVPDGFTVSINREPGNRFVITNDDKPGAPDDPDNPDDPDDPDNPDNPDEPDDPDEPDKPVNPDNPDTPDTPDQPDPIEVPDPPVPTDTVDVPGTPNDVPQTGDNAHLSLWAALALLSAAGLVFTQFSGKMNHKSKHGVK